MANNDLLLRLVIQAVDLATEDIEGVNSKVKELGDLLMQSPYTRAGNDMRAFGDAVKSATDPLAQATAKTLALNTALVGVTSLLASRAYQAAKDYESALAGLGKVLDGGIDAAKRYGAQLNQTAQQFAQNGQELVVAMTNFVQAGYSAEEAFKLVTESVKLMIAGELDAAQSSDLLVSILKGFKAPASEAAGTVDMLNEVSNKYATDVKQLAIGMAAISPIAKQMGFSMEETAGLLTPVIEVYRSGSEAADALKTGLQKLTDGTAPVKTALATIGVSQTDLNGKMRAGKDIFFDVARAFVGLTDAQKQYLTGELVGIDQAGRMSQVLTNLSGVLGATDAALNSSGSAMREVEVRLQTADAASRRADESFRQLSVTLANTFKPQVQGVVNATSNLAAAFDRSVKAGDLAPLLNVIKPQIAAIENLFNAMAGNLEAALSSVDWRPLVDGLKAVSGELGDAFGKLTEGMDLTTVEGLRTLLQSIINLLGNFSQFVAGAVDGLEPLLGTLNTLYGIVTQNSPALANLAGEISGLATSANQIIPLITGVGGALFGVLGTIAETALKVGLLVAGLRLLSAVGIPVVSILGSMTTAFFALNPAVASVATTLAGFPGLVAALVLGAGALGAGIGELVNRFAEWASGGLSVGSMLADLVDKLTGINDEITRGATPEELAIARTERLARSKDQLAKSIEAAAAAQIEAEKKANASIQAQEKKLELNAAEEETMRRLEAGAAKLGLTYDRVTGAYLRQGEATAQQRQESRDLAAALEKLGVNANYMASQITAGGQDIIATFRSVTQNAQATGKQIEAAFDQAIDSAKTEAEVQKILEAYQEWASGAGKAAADVYAATTQADQKTVELRKSTEGKAESDKKANDATRNYSGALQDNSAAVDKNADALNRNAEASDSAGKKYTLMVDAATAAGMAIAHQSQGVAELLDKLLHVTSYYNDITNAGNQWSTELSTLQQRLSETNQVIEYNSRLAGTLRDGWSRMVNAVNTANQAFLEQEIKAVSLRDQLKTLTEQTDSNADALYRTAQEAERAKTGLGLLNKERLDQLQQAIDSANSKLRAMQDEAQTAKDRLLELDAELARARGDTSAADKIDLERQRLKDMQDVEDALAKARAANNRELIAAYEEQERKLKTLYALQETALSKKQTASETTQQTASGGNTTATTSGGSGGGVSSGKTYRLDLTAGGKSLTTQTDQDPQAFLDALERAKTRSLST